MSTPEPMPKKRKLAVEPKTLKMRYFLFLLYRCVHHANMNFEEAFTELFLYYLLTLNRNRNAELFFYDITITEEEQDRLYGHSIKFSNVISHQANIICRSTVNSHALNQSNIYELWWEDISSLRNMLPSESQQYLDRLLSYTFSQESIQNYSVHLQNPQCRAPQLLKNLFGNIFKAESNRQALTMPRTVSITSSTSSSPSDMPSSNTQAYPVVTNSHSSRLSKKRKPSIEMPSDKVKPFSFFAKGTRTYSLKYFIFLFYTVSFEPDISLSDAYDEVFKYYFYALRMKTNTNQFFYKCKNFVSGDFDVEKNLFNFPSPYIVDERVVRAANKIQSKFDNPSVNILSYSDWAVQIDRFIEHKTNAEIKKRILDLFQESYCSTNVKKIKNLADFSAESFPKAKLIALIQCLKGQQSWNGFMTAGEKNTTASPRNAYVSVPESSPSTNSYPSATTLSTHAFYTSPARRVDSSKPTADNIGTGSRPLIDPTPMQYNQEKQLTESFSPTSLLHQR